MSNHAEKCPVCNGAGIVKDENSKSHFPDKICHGCKGIGWVTVEDKTEGEPKVTFVTNEV